MQTSNRSGTSLPVNLTHSPSLVQTPCIWRHADWGRSKSAREVFLWPWVSRQLADRVGLSKPMIFSSGLECVLLGIWIQPDTREFIVDTFGQPDLADLDSEWHRARPYCWTCRDFVVHRRHFFHRGNDRNPLHIAKKAQPSSLAALAERQHFLTTVVYVFQI